LIVVVEGHDIRRHIKGQVTPAGVRMIASAGAASAQRGSKRGLNERPPTFVDGSVNEWTGSNGMT
jgi:hypothetical protein